VDHIKATLKNIPEKPGVYRYYGIEDELLYIGKAKNLKKRVSSYFQNKPHNERMTMMISLIVRIEYTVVANERESLILEANLIHNLQPRYNILLKDDKNYVYVRITNDPIPNITFTRRKFDPKSKYYGPYTKKFGIMQTLRTLRSIFPYCNERFPQKKACNYVGIRQCEGICVGEESQADYRARIQQIERVLSGKTDQVKEFIDSKIAAAIKLENFELAALWRDRWNMLKDTVDDQKIILPQPIDLDLISAVLHLEDGMAGVTVQSIRGGKILNVHSYLLSGIQEKQAYEVWERLLPTLANNSDVAPVLLEFWADAQKLQLSTMEKEVLEELTHLKLYTNNIFGPNKLEIRGLLDQGKENASIYLERNKLGQRLSIFEEQNLMNALGSIRDQLGLQKVPRRMECFDISHLSGTHVYGSMAVFVDGRPMKKLYRLFKTVQRNDDFKNQAEVLQRRMERALQAEIDSPWRLPDLFVIDGGQPQMQAVLPIFETYKRLFAEAGKTCNTEICAIAKPDDLIVMPYNAETVKIKGSGYFIFQRIRDEAHRFAITRNRKNRLKDAQKSELDSIAGIGPVTKQKLLRTFGSVKRIVESLWENPELMYEVVGTSTTQKLLTHFNIDASLMSR
jgi:excinuclease ABC subunit C